MAADLSRRVHQLEKRATVTAPFDVVLFAGEHVPSGVDPERVLWIELVGVEPSPRPYEEPRRV